MDENNLTGQQNQLLPSVAPPTSNPTPPTPPSPTASPATPAPVQPSTPETPAPEPTMITTDALDKEAAEAPKPTMVSSEDSAASQELSPIESLIVGENALKNTDPVKTPVVPPLTVVSNSDSFGDASPNLANDPTTPQPTPAQPAVADPVPAQSTAPAATPTATPAQPAINPATPAQPSFAPASTPKKAPIGLIIGIAAGAVALIAAIILIIVLSSKHMLNLDEFETKIKAANVGELDCDSDKSDKGGYASCFNHDYASSNYIGVHYLFAKDKSNFEDALKEGELSEVSDKNFYQKCDDDGECDTYIKVGTSLLYINANKQNTEKIRKALGY